MNMIFLMDPLESLHIKKDTTFALMCEAHRRGYKVFYMAMGGVSIREARVRFDVTEVYPRYGDEKNPFVIKDQHVLDEDDVQVLFIRKDPPFDDAYLMQTWLLERVSHKIFMINHPEGIRTVNEKIWVTQFAQWTPLTLVTCHEQTYLKFLEEQCHVILKPTSGFGGQGVCSVRQGESNARVMFELLSRKQKDYVIVQAYVPGADKGDKRILVLDGRPLGAVLRVQEGLDHRHNFFAGGKPHATDISAKEKNIVEQLAPQLKQLGLHFVGLDFIAEKLIEVNVTSPTCLREMNALYDVRLEAKVLDFVEQSFKNLRLQK